ncbi:replication initiator protein A [Paraburkholderia youngii]|uniref:Replication initiator protein A n=1 Tax=Paraburkholderia youngii TaxID=2782701 RepID=A0A7Y6N2C3_9BURK|nr:replication initiator protein A [Paraburkholderia youngii]NUY06078.1 replication initiator protein A [Paraburkholderia youngii]
MNHPEPRAHRRTRTYLKIDFDKKDLAKCHGARWDAERKCWYVLGPVPVALMNYINLTVNAMAAASENCAVATPATASSMRPPPSGDEQLDFFVPSLYDVAAKDDRSIMDVAVFRLSKREKRAGEVIRYELPDGYVEVKAGPHGMASVWDYDIVLMIVSHLTEATNRYQARLGPKPGRVFRPHISEILKFCRKGDGGRQAIEVEASLARLKGTTIKNVRIRANQAGRPVREVNAEGLIGDYSVVSYQDNGRVASVEIQIPGWLYREVTEGKKPDVLTVHPDYFLIEPGIGRFLYRLARRAAGRNEAKWAFQTLYERSGSAGTFKEFCRMLRKIILANDLPEYDLGEEAGQGGPLIVMRYRDAPALAMSGV